MSAYTQSDRLLSMITPLGSDVLLLTNFTGREEMSRLFTFHLEMFSEEDVINPRDILGGPVTVGIRMPNDELRFFNGFINKFNYLGKNDRLNVYTAEMVPWMWFLTRTHDCRIFQQKTVPQIITQIFKDLGFTDFEAELKEAHPTWEYCVQYRESDFNFVSRLMEHEGIFYFFRHENGKHTLVMSDNKGAYADAPESEVTFAANAGAPDRDDAITAWEHRYQFGTGRWAQTDYNFETPSANLMTRSSSMVQLADLTKFEIYDYPGEYDKKEVGDELTRMRMEQTEAGYELVHGASKCRTFSPGLRFKLAEHHNPDEQDKQYVLTVVEHRASFSGSMVSGGGSGAIDYSNSFECIPDSVVFRPERKTPKPIVHGSQTAVIVGPAGQEIYTDKYGRVKVQFFWDREGTRNEKSSCWMRVSQPWAGKNWGAIFNPRIGQEVIVSFLEGDPDQPLITGRVYNAEMMPPYGLPDSQTQTGIKSRSSPGGTSNNFNELRFEDLKGKEEVYMQAEKNLTVHVKNSETENVGSSISTSAGASISRSAGSDISRTAGKNITDMAGASLTVKTGKGMSLKAGADYSLLTNQGISLKTISLVMEVIEAGIDSAMAALKGDAGAAGDAAKAALKGDTSKAEALEGQAKGQGLAALGPTLAAGGAELSRMSGVADKGEETASADQAHAAAAAQNLSDKIASGAGPEEIGGALMGLAAAAADAISDAKKFVADLLPQIPSIVMWAMKDISGEALWGISFTAKFRDISLSTGTRDIILGAKKNVNIEAEKKDVSVKAGENIILQTGDSNITMKKDGTITIEGKNITIKGKDIVIDGSDVSVKASGDITLKGSSIASN